MSDHSAEIVINSDGISVASYEERGEVASVVDETNRHWHELGASLDLDLPDAELNQLRIIVDENGELQVKHE